MVSVYNDADYLSAYKQKRKIWWVFMSITLVYLAICVALVAYHSTLPYAAPYGNLFSISAYVLSAAYMIFAFPYLAIKYGRVRRYVRLLSYVSTGLKQEECYHFYCFADQPLPKDNVDARSCIFEVWNEKKREWQEREVYFDVEKPLPPFESGDLVRYVLQGKFIIQYEIVQKHALEFEEVDEFEEEQVEESRIEE